MLNSKEQLEKALRTLVPRAPSAGLQSRIGNDLEERKTSRGRFTRPLAWSSATALLAASLAIVFKTNVDRNAQPVLEVQVLEESVLSLPSRGQSFLGAHVSRVEEGLSSRLGLDSGVGLIVDRVDLGSPAELYGIRKDDILTLLEDQLLIHPSQLRALFENGEPDRVVQIGIIREGEADRLSIRLRLRDTSR